MPPRLPPRIGPRYDVTGWIWRKYADYYKCVDHVEKVKAVVGRLFAVGLAMANITASKIHYLVVIIALV